MFNVFKALKLQGVATLPGVTRPAGPGAQPAGDWYADYQDWLIDPVNQPAANTTTGGNWPGLLFSCCGAASGSAGPTALGLLILSSVALVLPDEDKFATVGLAPATGLSNSGAALSHTVTATAESESGAPVPGATVTFRVLSGPNANRTGQAVTGADGKASFTYFDAGGSGTDTIQAFIGNISSNQTTMIWNSPPTANDDAYTIDEDSVLAGNVRDNDTDDLGITSSVLDSSRSHGLLTLNADGSFSYTPAANFFGSDSFTYHDNDAQHSSNVATAIITINALNDAPVAQNDSASGNEDTEIVGNVLTNDSDIDLGEDDSLSAQLVAGPSHGSVALNPDGSFAYTPALDFNGTDTFTYTASDGAAPSNVAEVTITVTAVNDAPVADPGSATTDEDVAVTGQVTSSDIDGGAPTYTLAMGGQASNGTAVVNPDGTFSYTPDANFNGSDSFSYLVDDGAGGSDIETVSITVNPVNDAPVADAGSATTDEDTAVSGQVTSSDIDGGAPTYSLAMGGQASNGTAVVNPNGTFSYTPNANFNGSDSFSYVVDDSAGGSDTETVTITVNAVNDAPVADPLSVSTDEDTPFLGNVPVHDVDGDPLTVTLVTGVSHGTLVLNRDVSFLYTPALNYNGPDSFTYQVSDGRGGVAIGTVNITVGSVNDDPVCSVIPDISEVWPPNHRMVPISLSGATDLDGDPVTLLVTGIFQDEPTNTQGDGNTSSDASGVGTPTPSVRAERSGSPRVPGNGRVYHIYVSGRDGQGGSCTTEVTVAVPHDQGGGDIPVDDGPLFNAVTGAPGAP